MHKIILITGATDGIGLETARKLVAQGHHLLLHGRNRAKLDALAEELVSIPGAGLVETFMGDLSSLQEVDALADAVLETQAALDVLINNAGVFRTSQTRTQGGLDTRFMVNTIAPYRLTRKLQSLLGTSGRVVNLSSAAQAPVDIRALRGEVELEAMEAYAQSKLAITMWSAEMATEADAPVVLAVNPGSLLASKMVREGFGVSGKDIGIGVEILCRASLDASFADKSGLYFDNDSGRFAAPHADAMNTSKNKALVNTIDAVLHRLENSGEPEP